VSLEEEAKDPDHQENDEEDLRDAGRLACDPGETEERSDDGDHEENEGPFKHDREEVRGERKRVGGFAGGLLAGEETDEHADSQGHQERLGGAFADVFLGLMQVFFCGVAELIGLFVSCLSEVVSGLLHMSSSVLGFFSGSVHMGLGRVSRGLGGNGRHNDWVWLSTL